MRDIPGFEGRYAITSDGQIWSYPKSHRTFYGHRQAKGRWLKPANSRGYLVSRLGADKPSCGVHRYVAMAYLENPSGHTCVNHINGNKSDNRVENLEWVTPAQNNRHAWAAGLSRPRPKILTAAQRWVIAELLAAKAFTEKELAALFGCGRTTVQRCR